MVVGMDGEVEWMGGCDGGGLGWMGGRDGGDGGGCGMVGRWGLMVVGDEWGWGWMVVAMGGGLRKRALGHLRPMSNLVAYLPHTF